ncbi:acetyl-CoA carboxylase biotin carboxylase subunit [Roseomonas sp. GC11]|uniref:acetyl/propionyl/methylcrotonyl-CoA carboxylase subunit alpha n=1 Tax=Roseomonas sp. GC11 TaxID=2950546 RepID=UPI00210DCD24|nr:acetyl-CoA carboxylase biotin carboxylase subunit [Roseomonas sp. GC11]MCQ4158334.1 acetyl-CoA carboxylase biotin carboxylase subunit [Roseomonas sp. GC11]
MPRKILVANRGEIACRIIATARRLGFLSVAVYSEADAGARHVRLADEALPIGPAAAAQSYLSIPALIAAARRSGAWAVHPGYGFLSENAAFARACAEAGLVFIGPPPEAIAAMGDKARAKALMQAAGVPLVPGYHGEAQAPEVLAAEAARIGWPVLIKASAGGGGKGMKVAADAAAFPAALESAQREAQAAFGDSRVLLEKYLQQPRHIEVQVFADTHGHVLHLFERDCSLQRRHQKVVEEAPAPGLDPARRAAMGEAAVAAARAVGYVGAGTVEFIAEGDGFFFMEMNTRLQVEHPVTEAITGLDLVEWQIRVADGEALPLRQEAVLLRGHAIEMRLYAEDPARDFLPATGRLGLLRLPRGEGVRVDSGVEEGDAVTPYYDPMLAKIIAWGEDRAVALARLRAALAGCAVGGVRSNLDLLRGIAAHPGFAAAELDTGFIARHPALLEAPPPAPPEAWAAAALALWQRDAPGGAAPWLALPGWRLNGPAAAAPLALAEGAEIRRLAVAPLPGCGLRVEGMAVVPDGPDAVRLDGHRQGWAVRWQGDALWLWLGGRVHGFRVPDLLAPAAGEAAGEGSLRAPIPGRVIRVLVEAGQAVARGAPLLVLEAMKTELTLPAPRAGVVESLRVSPGLMVEEGAVLVTLRPD